MIKIKSVSLLQTRDDFVQVNAADPLPLLPKFACELSGGPFPIHEFREKHICVTNENNKFKDMIAKSKANPLPLN